jgi:uncharacterized protein YabN with tetrapyrrole methylase and pyrophosphatase domain
VHASLALDGANAKFERRFDAISELARERGLVLGEMDLPAMDALWDEVKERGTREARRATRALDPQDAVDESHD